MKNQISKLTIENKNFLLKIENLSKQKEKLEISTQTPTLEIIKQESSTDVNHEIEELKKEIETKKQIIDQIIERSNGFQRELKDTQNENNSIKIRNNKLFEKIILIENSLNESIIFNFL